MRRLVYCIASTLDGFIAGPDGADPTGPDGFWPIADDYLKHLAAELPEVLPVQARAAFGITGEGARFDTVLEGRRTYELGLRAGITDAYPHLRHLVFSRTLTQSPDPAVELVATDPVAKVRELKGSDGKDIWLLGGSTLMRRALPGDRPADRQTQPAHPRQRPPALLPGHRLRPPHLGADRTHRPPERRGLPDIYAGGHGVRAATTLSNG